MWFIIPNIPILLQDEIGLKRECGAFNYNLGCSGYVYGLAMAKSFIHSKSASNILLVTTEWNYKCTDIDFVKGASVFGDGATLITKSNAGQIGEFNLASYENWA